MVVDLRVFLGTTGLKNEVSKIPRIPKKTSGIIPPKVLPLDSYLSLLDSPLLMFKMPDACHHHGHVVCIAEVDAVLVLDRAARLHYG